MLHLAIVLFATGLASIGLVLSGATMIDRAAAPLDPPIAPARAGRPAPLPGPPPLRGVLVLIGVALIGVGGVFAVMTTLLLAGLPPVVALIVLTAIVALPIAIGRWRRGQIMRHAR